VRGTVEQGDFIEIYCDSPIEVCEQRDLKGIYKKSRAGQIAEFTGISSPYEAPQKAALVVSTASVELAECVNQVVELLQNRLFFSEVTR
jgi:adenylylsulfate kinase